MHSHYREKHELERISLMLSPSPLSLANQQEIWHQDPCKRSCSFPPQEGKARKDSGRKCPLSGLPSSWLHLPWRSLRQKSLKPPPPHGSLVLIYRCMAFLSSLFSTSYLGKTGKRNSEFSSGINSRTQILMSPLPPFANPLAMGHFQVPKPGLPFAPLLSGPCGPQRPALGAGSPQHHSPMG